MLLESDILRLFFTGPYLVSSPLCSGVWCWLPLRGSTPTSLLFASLFSSRNSSLGSSHHLSSLGSSHQLPPLLSSHQLPSAACLSPVQLPTPLCSPATNCLSALLPPTPSSALQPPTAFCCLPLSWPATNSSLLSCHQLPPLLSSHQLPLFGSRRQLSFASPYHFRIRRDFRSKNPLSGFAPKQTRLLWRPTPIVLHTTLSYPCHLFSINYNTI